MYDIDRICRQFVSNTGTGMYMLSGKLSASHSSLTFRRNFRGERLLAQTKMIFKKYAIATNVKRPVVLLCTLSYMQPPACICLIVRSLR